MATLWLQQRWWNKLKVQDNGGSAKLRAQNATITRSVVIEAEADSTTQTSVETDPETGEETTVETQVYNGPTLDVKERLTKADTALQTLKTAAAAAVDFTELKTAIATALADI